MGTRLGGLIVVTVMSGLLMVSEGVSEPSAHQMRFGVNGGIYPESDAGARVFRRINRKLDELGIVWLRHPGRGAAWFEVQPEKGKWDFTKLDLVLQDNRHPWVLEIFGQKGTP